MKSDVWCENCDCILEVRVHSIITKADKTAVIDYTCLHCEKRQLIFYTPKEIKY